MADRDNNLDTAYIIATKITDKLNEELNGKDAEFMLIETSKDQYQTNN